MQMKTKILPLLCKKSLFSLGITLWSPFWVCPSLANDSTLGTLTLGKMTEPLGPDSWNSLAQGSLRNPGLLFFLFLLLFFVVVVCITLWPRELHERHFRLQARRFSRVEGISLPIQCFVPDPVTNQSLKHLKPRNIQEVEPRIIFGGCSLERLTLASISPGGCTLYGPQGRLLEGQYLFVKLGSLPEFPTHLEGGSYDTILGKVVWHKKLAQGQAFPNPEAARDLWGIRFSMDPDEGVAKSLQHYLAQLLDESLA